MAESDDGGDIKIWSQVGVARTVSGDVRRRSGVGRALPLRDEAHELRNLEWLAEDPASGPRERPERFGVRTPRQKRGPPGETRVVNQHPAVQIEAAAIT